MVKIISLGKCNEFISTFNLSKLFEKQYLCNSFNHMTSDALLIKHKIEVTKICGTILFVDLNCMCTFMTITFVSF